MVALREPLLFCVLSALIVTEIKSSPEDDDAFVSQVQRPALSTHLHQLKSKISSLELSLNERTRELRSKDERIKQMEVIFREQAHRIALLEGKIESFQSKGSFIAKKQKGEAHEQGNELEKEVDKLRKEINKQHMENDALEALASVAEKKIWELNSRLESVQGQWLPYWLVVHLCHFQSCMVTQWNERWRPALDVTVKEALEKKVQVEEWSHSVVETINTQWVPIAKEKWLTFTTYLEPRVQFLSTKIRELYHASLDYLTSYAVKALEDADPYIQVARRYYAPYMNQVTTVSKPHFDKAHIALKPYMEKTIHAYKRFIESTTLYHHQVQKLLKNNEFTRSIATLELAWFGATALLILPLVVLFKLYPAILSKKARKNKHSYTIHTRRRTRRLHPEQ